LNEVDARFRWITSPQPFPGDQKVAAGLALVNGAGQTIVMDIVEGEQLFRSLLAVVGCPQPLRLFLFRPTVSGHGLEFHRAKLIETDHRSLWGSFGVELQKAVFFDSKSGSGDSFHVLVR